MRVGSVRKGKGGASGSTGFTITELLVVMVIIGILAAIIFPVVLKAKETAKISECLSNMRQLSSGLTMYLNDYSDRFPAAVPWGRPSYWAKPELGDQKTIQVLLNPYVRSNMTPLENGTYLNTGVFCCPSDTGIPGKESTNGVPPNQPLWKWAGCSYEYYACNQVDWQTYNPEDPSKMDIKAWTALSPEIDGPNGLKRIGAPMWAITNQTRKAVLGDTWYWHMGDKVPDGRLAWRNTLFADGHVLRVNGTDHEEARLQPLKRWHSMPEVPEE